MKWEAVPDLPISSKKTSVQEQIAVEKEQENCQAHSFLSSLLEDLEDNNVSLTGFSYEDRTEEFKSALETAVFVLGESSYEYHLHHGGITDDMK